MERDIKRDAEFFENAANDTPVVFLDFREVIVERRPGRAGDAYSLRPGADEGLRRLAQITDRLVAVVEPVPPGTKRARAVESLDRARAAMAPSGPELAFVGCPHATDDECHCHKPESGLVELAVERHASASANKWHVSGSQEGVQAGRSAGLRTIRVGPPSEDHLTAVHRADYEARDLLDAANWILVSTLQGVRRA